MRAKILFFFCLLVGVHSFTFAVPDFSNETFPWLSGKGLTRYALEEDFRGNDSITRGEAAKFVTEYAKVIGLEKKRDGNCLFADISEYDNTLVPYIIEACEYRLMRGSSGKFMPNDTVTQAQALTIAIRTLDGFKDEFVTPWYREYVDRAISLGMLAPALNGLNGTLMQMVGDTSASRADVGTWLYMAAHTEKSATVSPGELYTQPAFDAYEGCVWGTLKLKSVPAKILSQNCLYSNGAREAGFVDESLPGFGEMTVSSDDKMFRVSKVQFFTLPINIVASSLEKRIEQAISEKLSTDMATLEEPRKSQILAIQNKGVDTACEVQNIPDRGGYVVVPVSAYVKAIGQYYPDESGHGWCGMYGNGFFKSYADKTNVVAHINPGQAVGMLDYNSLQVGE